MGLIQAIFTIETATTNVTQHRTKPEKQKCPNGSQLYRRDLCKTVLILLFWMEMISVFNRPKPFQLLHCAQFWPHIFTVFLIVKCTRIWVEYNFAVLEKAQFKVRCWCFVSCYSLVFGVSRYKLIYHLSLPFCLIYDMKDTVKRVCRGAFLTDDINISILVVLKKVEFKVLL